MPVTISSVNQGSPAARALLRAGDIILRVNGQPCDDVLDYRFYAETGGSIRLDVRRDSVARRVTLPPGETGLCFDTWLMSPQRRCKNNCMFCFIDQMPPGCRETLYFKDDDERLGFLYGNYITLTNLGDREIDRIIEMRLSPVNISVHTVDPALRARIMGNRFAGESLRHLHRLAAAGILLNFQLVLMPGINDGEVLRESLRVLSALPTVGSIAAVPVGLTAHRQGLTTVQPFTRETAQAVLAVIDTFGPQKQVYAADEFYLLAGRPMPAPSDYGEFVQLENGVGLIADFNHTIENALRHFVPHRRPVRVSMVTGTLAADNLREQVDIICEKWHNLSVTIYPVENAFFGRSITVAGLVTAGDILRTLAGRPLYDRLLLPSCMLRREGDLFLDDVSPAELSESLHVPVTICRADGSDFLKKLFG